MVVESRGLESHENWLTQSHPYVAKSWMEQPGWAVHGSLRPRVPDACRFFGAERQCLKPCMLASKWWERSLSPTRVTTKAACFLSSFAPFVPARRQIAARMHFERVLARGGTFTDWIWEL